MPADTRPPACASACRIAGCCPRTELLPSRTWAEVDLDAVRSNYRVLANTMAPGDALLVVVKADAYGHGLVPVATAAAQAGARHFGVATLAEGAALRRAGLGAEIHVLTPLLPEEAEDCARLGLTPYVSSLEFLDAYQRVESPFPPACFLMIDTGMGREGMSPDQATSILLRPPTNLEITGIATHLASADEPTDTLTAIQEHRFRAWLESIPGAGSSMWRSVANSPGMLRISRPDSGPVLWRPGASLYGISPYPGAPVPADLRPVLTWKARITLVRHLSAGSTVGYGATAVLSRDSRIATVAAGYADGLSRRLGNRGTLAVHGRACPIVGRVSMDQCQIDVTDVPEAKAGDTALLLGIDGGVRLTAESMAEVIGTTVHEPTTCLSARVPRVHHQPATCPR